MKDYKELLQNVSFPLICQLHVAKHLEIIADDFQKCMSIQEIVESQKFLGSIFFQSFATVPLQIIENAIAKGTQIRFRNVDYAKIELEISFEKEDFPLGIGGDSIVNINQLSQIEKQTLIKEIRNGNEVWVFPSKQLFHSWNLNIILHRNKNNWEVTTCFPGTFAPPLPFSYFKNNEDREKAILFWENHAFLKF